MMIQSRPLRSSVRARLRCALLAVALLGGLGCDNRARELRAELSDADLQRFIHGQQLSSPCWSCHDFYGNQNKIGPYLGGLYGRRAGTARFPGYSDALRQSMVVWDDSTLAHFLRSPTTYVPGTTMVSPGVASPQDLDALLFYMRLATAPHN